METEGENNESVRGRSKRRNCQRKCFHSFKHAIDHGNVLFFFWVNCFFLVNNCFMWFLRYYLLHLLGLFCSCHKFIANKFVYLNTIVIYEFFKNHPQRKVFRKALWMIIIMDDNNNNKDNRNCKNNSHSNEYNNDNNNNNNNNNNNFPPRPGNTGLMSSGR